jgi:hypothetical protein
MSGQAHRSRRTALTAIVAVLAMAAVAAPAGARPPEHGIPTAPPNARGTDVAAPDQQAPRLVVNAPGTDVAARDQQSPVVVDRTDPGSAPVASDDSMPTLTVLALIGLALALAGIAFASWLAVSRKRHGAAV